jgi:hypothetical protein
LALTGESLRIRSFRDDRGHYIAWPLLSSRDPARRRYDCAPGPCACSRNPLLPVLWTEVEGLTGKWTEVLEFALGIAALDTGDALGVVTAKNELLNHFGDPLDTESAADDSELAFILLDDALKMHFKQNLEVIDTARPVHPLGNRRDRKGSLSLHIES